MATRPSTIDWLLEQAAGAGAVSARKMFGEYALYCDGKLVGLVCDDRFFLKPTEAGRAALAGAAEEPPYPSAKPQLVVPAETQDDPDALAALIRTTAAALPIPKPKRPKRERSA